MKKFVVEKEKYNQYNDSSIKGRVSHRLFGGAEPGPIMGEQGTERDPESEEK